MPLLLVKVVRLPAVALLVNDMTPSLPAPSLAVTKFCMVPELFVMPMPLIVSVSTGGAVIVNALAPAWKTMLLTSVLSELETPVILEDANVAVSAGPLGTVWGVQFGAVFQSLL